MESLWWSLKTRDSFLLGWPVLAGLFLLLIFRQGDFVILLIAHMVRLVTGRTERNRPVLGEFPSAIVIIPSLLRNREDFDAITLTVDACATNRYPGELVIMASVDGRTDNPALFGELHRWVAQQQYPTNVSVHVSSTESRKGKMMAVHAGVHLMESLVEQGMHAQFPELYFSIDGDGTLGEKALQRLAERIQTPHRFTGNRRRVVSGKVCIRPDLFWSGWNPKSLKAFFTVPGQIFFQVAREFVFSNVSRFNLKLMPAIGIPGALYCTHSEVLLQAPRFMGYMRSIRLRDWLGWWLGFGAPSFSASQTQPLPEAMTGASDDTCISFISSLATWREGRLCFDPPRTPFHAFGRLLRAYLWERSPDYEPEARVFTYTPSTIKGLWVQRVRWNASRFECGYRFKNALSFHWNVGVPVVFHLWGTLSTIFGVALYYFLLPYVLLAKPTGLLAYLLGYVVQVVSYGLYTLLALLIEREWRRFWPVLLAIPLAPLHCIGINFFACLTGFTKDLFLFGNTTKFAPEWTLKKGQTIRIALLFRIRRFLALCVRALWVGDVPWGTFWFGWRETPWTPSGYDGWTTGKRSSIIRRPRTLVLPPPTAPLDPLTDLTGVPCPPAGQAASSLDSTAP